MLACLIIMIIIMGICNWDQIAAGTSVCPSVSVVPDYVRKCNLGRTDTDL